MSTNHEGIRAATEEDAVAIFELPEVRDTADQVAAHWRDADTAASRAESCRRDAARKWLEAEAATQAEGGRLAKVEGNRLIADALVASAEHEARNVDGEEAWAKLAAKHGLYIPHGRRLEMQVAGRPGWVYCYDVDEQEMGMHEADRCPNGTLHHTGHVTMLRRRNDRGWLAPWPGRKV